MSRSGHEGFGLVEALLAVKALHDEYRGRLERIETVIEGNDGDAAAEAVSALVPYEEEFVRRGEAAARRVERERMGVPGAETIEEAALAGGEAARAALDAARAAVGASISLRRRLGGKLSSRREELAGNIERIARAREIFTKYAKPVEKKGRRLDGRG